MLGLIVCLVIGFVIGFVVACSGFGFWSIREKDGK